MQRSQLIYTYHDIILITIKCLFNARFFIFAIIDRGIAEKSLCVGLKIIYM